ncbi:hypothetical protein M407DRAFT_6905 [Tulasnella calospora MUT 4182]|uniref:Uncharacterized protein n=1 Tax=Tulasnella calospora MUT 4182 TaxID=1051891 RepID=A0A0C3L323_9AGAM|nr:hypothetical protein M407DRAFT_6905 [Tulasnella calospora MUT 4182]
MPSPSKTNASADDMEDEIIEELDNFDKTVMARVRLARVSALYGATNAAQLPLNLSNQGIQPPQQQQQQQQSQLAFQSGTGLLTPNYTIQPQSQPSLAQQQVLGIVGAQDYTQSLIYQQALAEQQALARKLAQLERLQQAARLAAQDPFANLNSGRGFS